MRAVNLMPRDERAARLETGRLPLVAAAGGVVLVTALAFYLASSASSARSEHEAEKQAVEATIAKLPRAPGSAVSVGEVAQERSSRVAALAAALTSRTAFDRVLREISYVLPADAWLTTLEATAPPRTSALPADEDVPQPQAVSATGVTIEGAAFSHDTIAKVVGRLSVIPSLTDVRLTSTALVEPQPDGPSAQGDTTTATRTRTRPFVTFVVSASVNSGGGS